MCQLISGRSNNEYKKGSSLKVKITAFMGLDDKPTIEEMLLWQKESGYSIKLIKLTGNHFFIFKHWKAIAHEIEKTVLKQTIK